ncbi:MAG: hypothetical protein Q9227_001514 [Pyrenula ochraceoflavens]
MDDQDAKPDVESAQPTKIENPPEETKPSTASATGSVDKKKKNVKMCNKHSKSTSLSKKQSKKAKSGKSRKGKKPESDGSETGDSSPSSSSSATESDSDSDGDSSSEDSNAKARKKLSAAQKLFRKRGKADLRPSKRAESSSDDESSSSSEESSEQSVKSKRKNKEMKKAHANKSKSTKKSKSEKGAIFPEEIQRILENLCLQAETNSSKTTPKSSKQTSKSSKTNSKSSTTTSKSSKAKAQASKSNQKRDAKAKFKRVDHLWDEETHRYKLQETVEDPDEAVWDKYAFTVRRRFDWEHKYLDTIVDIKSQPLKDALAHIFNGVSGISMAVKTPNVDPNMLFLFLEEMRAYAEELKSSAKTLRDKKSRRTASAKSKHLKLVVKYLDTDYADTKKTLYPLLDNKTISFDLLWALFKPNSIIYSPTYGDTEEPRAFKIEHAYKHCHPTKGIFYSIEGQYLEYDGKNFGHGKLRLEVPSFKGIRKVASLDCYPLEYHEDKEAVKELLIKRGKAFVALKGTHYRQYAGMAYVKTKKGTQKLSTNGRVMVDPASFRRMNPNYLISNVSPPIGDEVEIFSGDDSEDDCCCCSNSGSDVDIPQNAEDDDQAPRRKKKYRMFYDEETDQHILAPVEYDEDGQEVMPKQTLEEKSEEEFTEEDLLIASPVALGFSFHDKTWLELKVSALTHIVWNEDAFDSLVLPPEQKGIIKALVESHKFHPAKNVDDVISGKGKGLVAVLHGPPGTGKTLTAEGIAELLKCPLYMVSTGELGTDARTLERELQNILEITQVWGALLLLDEADVFLEQRGTFDLHRNAMVGIFLRTLEYFSGILFLTTNRVHNFDSAFQSRIHLALQYKELDYAARKNVWEVFFKRVKSIEGMQVADFKPDDIDELARIDLNGRQIKNSTRMAQALAVNRQVPLSMKEIKEVLNVAREFKDYFVGGPGWKEAEHAYS